MAKERKPWQQYTRAKWPGWLKTLLLKWWAAGALLFFIGWGLPIGLSSMYLALLLGVVGGVFTDLIGNNILRVAVRNNESEPYMMWPQGGAGGLVLNVLHSVLIAYLIMLTYTAVNVILIGLLGLEATAVPLGVEPILFGLLYLGFDMLLILIKRRVQALAAEEKAKKSA